MPFIRSLNVCKFVLENELDEGGTSLLDEGSSTELEEEEDVPPLLLDEE